MKGVCITPVKGGHITPVKGGYITPVKGGLIIPEWVTSVKKLMIEIIQDVLKANRTAIK